MEVIKGRELYVSTKPRKGGPQYRKLRFAKKLPRRASADPSLNCVKIRRDTSHKNSIERAVQHHNAPGPQE